ncbi:MAG: hypothetical protein JNL58_19205 [Planctomyces sp.]|nr:hypothetical protein [Planctomyces sp.]
MRRLFALSLCFASMFPASGDEFDAGRDSRPEQAADTNDTQVLFGNTEGESGAKEEDASKWCPRLQIVLNSNENLSKISTAKERVREPNPFESEPQPGGSVVYRDGDLHVFAVSPADITTLYCDSITLNVTDEGDATNYSIECKSRVRIRLNGMDIDAESASLKDGKCELVNAKFTHGKTTATASQLTLSLPIHGLSTKSFGRPVPEIPPAANLNGSPTPFDGPFRPVPDPIGGGRGSDLNPDFAPNVSDSPRTY